MVNRHGSCPYCKTNWDGGDIRNHIQSMDINAFKSEKDIDAMAADYGWTPENKKRLSLVRVYEMKLTPLTTSNFLECPSCMRVFDEVTEEKYYNIFDAKKLSPIVGEVPDYEDSDNPEIEEEEEDDEEEELPWFVPE